MPATFKAACLLLPIPLQWSAPARPRPSAAWRNLMSTFAVFGMTADVALPEARSIPKTTKPAESLAPPWSWHSLSGMRP